jgi:hypothetical protein
MLAVRLVQRPRSSMLRDQRLLALPLRLPARLAQVQVQVHVQVKPGRPTAVSTAVRQALARAPRDAAQPASMTALPLQAIWNAESCHVLRAASPCADEYGARWRCRERFNLQ